LATQPLLEDAFQQSAKLPQSRQFNAGGLRPQAQAVRSSQQTGSFTESNCLGEFTAVVVWLGYVPVMDGVDEVECRMPAYQFEAMPPYLSHSNSLSPPKAI
jgi:hypothetical protein